MVECGLVGCVLSPRESPVRRVYESIVYRTALAPKKQRLVAVRDRERIYGFPVKYPTIRDRSRRAPWSGPHWGRDRTPAPIIHQKMPPPRLLPLAAHALAHLPRTPPAPLAPRTTGATPRHEPPTRTPRHCTPRLRAASPLLSACELPFCPRRPRSGRPCLRA